MAVTAFGQGYLMTSTDTLNQATVGHPQCGAPFVTRINAINVVGGAGGAVTLRAGGTSGTIIWSGTTTAGVTLPITFSEPQDFDDFAVSVNAGGSTVVVFIA